MLEKIAASGLSAEDAHKLGFNAMLLPPVEISIRAAGFVLPYHKITGQRNGFLRYRYLEKIYDEKGKLIRYTQPAGAAPQPYFSKLFPWVQYLDSHKGEARAVVITEGELKADCACKYGVPCIGLGGVYNFRSRKEAFIEGLRQIDWSESTVCIVYDSDASSNFQVVRARNALSAEFLALNAQVFPVDLPALTATTKTGLDDFIMARGVEAFKELLNAAQPWAPSRTLHELNEEVVFIQDPGLVLRHDTLQRMSRDMFARSVYANRIWEEEVVAAKGKTKIEKRGAAEEWIKWPSRSEVLRLTYAPGQERITDEREANLWRGWGVAPAYIKKGDTSLWREFMDYFFKDDPTAAADRRWMEQWLAYPLQHPGTKLYTALVVHSTVKGCGKSLLGHSMKEIYGLNFEELDEDQLKGDFNEWAQNKQFIMAEEIAGGDKRGIADKLKGMITRPTIRINAKHLPTYVLPDCMNYYFNSNHHDSFFVEDGDRRLFIHEVRCGRLVDIAPEFLKQYVKWIKSPEGAGALFYYFLHLNLTGFDPTAPARETVSRKAMIELGRSDAEAWVAELKEHPENVLKSAMLPVPLAYTLVTLETLFNFWDPEAKKKLTKQGLMRSLKAGGFRQAHQGEPIWSPVEKRVVKLWIVQGDRKALEQLSPAKIGAAYDEERKAGRL
jgi:hypothetical protein